MRNYLRLSFLSLVTLFASVPALADEGGKAGGGFFAVGAGIAIGIAALGGALGQGKAVGSALEGISRNPAAEKKISTPMLIGLAFMESLVIFAWVMAYLILGKA